MKKKDTIFGLGLAGLLALLSFLASSWPDGLEKVAEAKGFLSSGKIVLHAPMPDYFLPFIKNENLSGGLAGLAGVFIVFALAFLLGKLIKAK